ncbi:MAG: signal peptidase I [Bacteroidales bacterium]|nr:signal peptidase I [Bacteroidales bacterium]
MHKDLNKQILIRNIGFSLLSEGKTLKIRADGYSMYPSVRPGSLIFIEPLPEDTEPAPGDLIAWKRETGFVVHRLTEIKRQDNDIKYITRGDSCANEDAPVSRDQIAGKVIRIEDPGGIIRTEKEFIRNPAYFYNRIIVWLLLRSKKFIKLMTRIQKADKGKIETK